MTAEPPDIDIRPVGTFDDLAPDWLDLEARASGSFFQSWAWTGCLAEARFPDPWLLTARRGGEIVGLALFNRASSGPFGLSRRLLLGETGQPAFDAMFIEHNGLLLDRREGNDTARLCWAALDEYRRDRLGNARWVLSGVSQTMLSALPRGRNVRITARRPAPYVDFSTSMPDIPIIDTLSANSRQQLRRSLRAWEEIGPLKLERAATHEEADSFLDALAKLHQAYWTGRGKPGAFSQPFFARFHKALIRRPSEGQSVDLMRLSAGDRVIGYLYNFVHHAWVAAYQSGFDFGPDADRLRPGLVCHLMAIEHYRRAGMRLYDFLGGEARYKRSFANAETELLWLDVRPRPWQSCRPSILPS